MTKPDDLLEASVMSDWEAEDAIRVAADHFTDECVRLVMGIRAERAARANAEAALASMRAHYALIDLAGSYLRAGDLVNVVEFIIETGDEPDSLPVKP